MIPAYREQYNSDFSEAKYERFLRDLNREAGYHIDFRIAESPLFVPKDFSEMVRRVLNGDIKEAQKLHYKLTDTIEKIFADEHPAGIKAVLEIMNICKAHLRLPLINVNAETQKAISKLVADY